MIVSLKNLTYILILTLFKLPTILVLSAIDFAIRNFQQEYGKKKFNKRIFIMTDGNSLCNKSKINTVANLIKQNDVKVNIICINFYNELNLEDGEVMEEDTDNKQQQETKHCLQQLLEKCDEQIKIFSAEQAQSIQNQFRKKKINPVVKYRGPLKITPNLSLDVCIYVKSSVVGIPALKKYSKNTEFQGDIKANTVKMERTFYIHDDPEQTPVSEDRIMKAYYYGKSLVPVSKEEEQMFKCLEDKEIRAIGFTDNYNVPRHHYMSGSDVVFPNPNDSTQVKAFYSMVEAMISQNKVLICRFISRAKSEPKLVVLSPHIGTHGPVLYLNQLPTIEDIRDYQFDSLQECTIKQEEVISGFIDEMDLDANEETGQEELLKPSETYNPILQYFYQCLEHRALTGNETELPEMDEKIMKLLNPTKDKMKESKYANALKEVFTIKMSKSTIN